MKKIPISNIWLTPEANQQLADIAQRERRSKGKQAELMLEQALQHETERHEWLHAGKTQMSPDALR